ncbi:MAG: hypothetical protein K5654_01160 [Lachnospiraceae bacterium]|nr:hypothetical protein [Lachnospiraceae bacterium]
MPYVQLGGIIGFVVVIIIIYLFWSIKHSLQGIEDSLADIADALNNKNDNIKE